MKEKNKAMKVATLFIALAILLTLTACSGRSSGGGSLRAAVIDDFAGTVTALSDEKEIAAFKGLALLRRDALDTGWASWSSLELDEGRFILVEENSNVSIAQLSDDAKNTEITLLDGKIWVVITNKLSGDERFEVNTPTCSLTVRGTVFSVSCGADGGSRAAVYEGTAQFIANDGKGEDVSFDVTEGAAEVVVANGTVVEVIQSDLTDDDLAPLYAAGPEGPGGVLAILRTRLPSLVWDEDHPFGSRAAGADQTDTAATLAAWTRLTASMGIPMGMTIYDIPGITGEVIARFEEGPISHEVWIENYQFYGGLGSGTTSFWAYGREISADGTEQHPVVGFRVNWEDTAGDYLYYTNLEGIVNNVSISKEAAFRLWGFIPDVTTKEEILSVLTDDYQESAFTNSPYFNITFNYYGYGFLRFTIDADSYLVSPWSSGEVFYLHWY